MNEKEDGSQSNAELMDNWNKRTVSTNIEEKHKVNVNYIRA